MIKVQINGKVINLKEPTPLKELVSDLKLPCGGRGICGRCKITAQGIAATAKDLKFFTSSQLEQGARIACDKIISQDCIVNYLSSAKVQERKKIEYCSMFALLGIQNIIIGMLDDDILQETLEIKHNFDIEDAEAGKKLKARLIQASLELMEDYKVPQAPLLLLAGNAQMLALFLAKSYDKLYAIDYRDAIFDSYSGSGAEHNLPVEDLFLLPWVNGYLGSDIISALAALDENTLFIDFSHIPLFALKTSEGYLLAPFFPLDKYHPLPNEAYLAAIKYFNYLNPQINKALIRGSLPFSLPKELACVNAEEKIIEFLCLAAAQRKYRTKADKIRRQCSIINLSEEPLWQDFFSCLCQSGNN